MDATAAPEREIDPGGSRAGFDRDSDRFLRILRVGIEFGDMAVGFGVDQVFAAREAVDQIAAGYIRDRRTAALTPVRGAAVTWPARTSATGQ